MDNSLIDLLKLFLQYGVGPVAALGWYMFKKHEFRIEALERRTTELEKAVVRIETQLGFISSTLERIDHKLQ